MRRFTNKRKIAVISALYFCLMLFFLYRFGVNSNGEAEKYIYDANAIVKGEPLNGGIFSLFYFSYSLFVSFFTRFSISFFWLGFVQSLISYFAGRLLYRLLRAHTGNELIAFAGFAVFLFCFPVQKWTLFVYSEGVHTSLTVIGLCFFFRLMDNASLKNILLFLLFLALILTTRPVGILFLICCFLTLLYRLGVQKKKKALLSLCGAGVFIFIGLLNSPFRYFINPDSLRRMEVICQVPTAGGQTNYTEFNRTGLGGAYAVIKNEIGFGNFFRNGLLKLRSFFGLVRPYYSAKNNLFLGLYLLLYPFALAGIFFYRNKTFNPLRFFCIIFICITAAGIFVTCDDWSDRFISPIFPAIIILAAAGFSRVKDIVTPYTKSNSTL